MTAFDSNHGMPKGHAPGPSRGCQVLVLQSKQTRNIKARTFYGALNLDGAVQPCVVTFLSSYSAGGGTIIAVANKLGTSGAVQAIPGMPPQGIALSEGAMTITLDVDPTGNGIAVYYDV